MIVRFNSNPIITSKMKGLEADLGRNINGPSLIRVPSWVSSPLGKYYLYFAHHKGEYIRLAFSNNLNGPWEIYNDGVLSVDETVCVGHIASPDVHIDELNKRIVMYFHGEGTSNQYPEFNQLSYVATSKNGLDFTALNYPIAPFYLRVFKVNNEFYGVAKNRNKSGLLLVSEDWLEPFTVLDEIIPRMRHVAIFVQKTCILLFYSRIGDCPESILLRRISLVGFPQLFSMSDPELVAEPIMEYEGINIRAKHSEPGKSKSRSREIRDPAIFSENDSLYLLYSNAGEQGLCISEYLDKANEKIPCSLINEYYIRMLSSKLSRQVLRQLKKLIRY